MREYNLKTSQSILEYALLIGVSVGALLAMAGYIQRGLQGKLNAVASTVGEEYSIAGGTSSISKSGSSFSFEDGLTPLGFVYSFGSEHSDEKVNLGPLAQE